VHQNSLLLFNKYAPTYFAKARTVLEIGARIPSGYLQALNRPDLEWKYMDIEEQGLSAENLNMQRSTKVDYVVVEENKFPVPDDSFDVVFSAQVLEHVREPWVWYKEIARIIRPGGYVVTISPISWPYHEAPIDCWRIFPDGMAALYKQAGLEQIFAKRECLESQAKRIIPGIGLDSQTTLRRSIMGFMGAFGWPVEAAVDLITVAQKSDEVWKGA